MNRHYGNYLDISSDGASHGPQISVTVGHFPAGVFLSEDRLHAFLKRRAPGRSPFSSPRREEDVPVFSSGVVSRIDPDGRTVLVTDGSPIKAIIANRDVRDTDYPSVPDIPRPSHADYPALMKAQSKNLPPPDLRGGGKYSGRMTAPLCVAGAFCISYLETLGIHVGAHILQIGSVKDTPYPRLDLTDEVLFTPGSREFPILDPDCRDDMLGEIAVAARSGDSVGGVVECGVTGLLPGQIGDRPFDTLDGRLSYILFSLPSVKAVAFGDGFDVVGGYGSSKNDGYTVGSDGKITCLSNHSGGVLGGMSSGAPLLFTVAVKPTPSISRPQHSVSLSTGKPAELCVKGRHDPCIVPRIVPVIEAATAIALADMLLSETEYTES